MSWNIAMPATPYVCRYEDPHRQPGDIIVGTDEFTNLLNEAKAHQWKAIDTETTGLVSWKDIPLYWSMAWEGRKITLNANVLSYFTELFKDESTNWILANAKYDAHILANVGVHLEGQLVDICVAHALLYEEHSHGLKDVARHLLSWTWADFQDSFGKIGKKNSAEDVIRRAERENFDLLKEYAANDAWGTYQVFQVLKKQLEEAITHSLYRLTPPFIETLWDFFWKLEVPYTKVLWKMERRGIKVDRQHLENSRPEAVAKIEELEKGIWKAAGFALNPSSSQQLAEYFYDIKKYKPFRWTKGGRTGKRSPSADVHVIRRFALDGDPVAMLVEEHRNYSKLLSTYINGLHKLLDPHDRIHTRYNQDVARCMPAGELVLTSSGCIPVEDVQVGDLVITHEGRQRPVIETSAHDPQDIYEIEMSNGLVLRTTGHHEYYQGGTKWCRADQLLCGDPVAVHSGPEMWEQVPGWPEYLVSSWGRVRSLATKKLLKQRAKGKWGHLKVTLTRNGAQKRGPDKKDKAVHRLVLEAFTGPSAQEVRHLNGISWDNTLDNLCYGSSKENSEDAKRHGTLRGAPRLTPEQVEEIRNTAPAGQPPSSTAKLTYADAEVIRARYSTGERRAELAREYGVSHTALSNIVTNKTWTKPPSGTSAEELGERFGVSPACIRDIWAGRRWAREHKDPVAGFHVALVRDIRHLKPQKVYGLTVEEDHSHVTGGVVTHNTGRLSSSNPNCFTGETEVLTPRGWVPLKCLEENATVAQWEDEVIEFVPVTGFVKAPCESVTTITTTHITLEVTQDHRCLLVNRKTREPRVVAAADYKSDYRQLNAGEYSGPGLELQDEEIQFLVAVQADGSWVHRASGARHLDVGFKKPRKYRRFETLLRAIGATYTRTEGSNKRVRFRVKGAASVTAWEYLGLDKKLGPWVLELSREQLDVFTEEVWFWDGCWTRKNHYASKDRDNASWVQAALALSNNRARLRKYVNSTGSVSWQVDRTARNYSLTTNHKKGTKATTDGYVYCVSVPSSFLLVRTGQNICVTGNCQNIPRKENDHWDLRGAFIPSPGNSILALDYEQLEMRLLAAASMEESMIDIFRRNWDIHMGNAHMMYEVPYDDLAFAKRVEKHVKQGLLEEAALDGYNQSCLTMRSDAKTIGFGLNYGMGANRLANQLGCTYDEAMQKIKAYKSAYPAVETFFQEAVEETRKTGYAFTLMGRRRNVPQIASHIRWERAQGERIAINTPIQGSAADVCRYAQIRLDRLGLDVHYDCYMLLQVHDELVFECPQEAAVEVKPVIQEIMEHPFCEDLAVHLAVDGAVGPSWGAAK